MLQVGGPATHVTIENAHPRLNCSWYIFGDAWENDFKVLELSNKNIYYEYQVSVIATTVTKNTQITDVTSGCF